MSFRRGKCGSAHLAIEQAGLVPGPIKIDVLLVHRFVPVHAVLLTVGPQGMIPPIEHRKPFRVVHRVPVLAAGVLADEAAGDVIDRAVTFQGIQKQIQPRFTILQFVDPGANIGLKRQGSSRDMTGGRNPRHTDDHENETD